MPWRDNRTFLLTLLMLLVGAITVPYLYAWQGSGPTHIFGGVLFNLQDGYSYLAKMHQGWSGDWKFSLTYTAGNVQGAYLFLPYLALGHLARLFRLSLELTYHLARVLAAIFMVLSLARYLGYLIPESRAWRFGLLWATLGSGMGWLALPWGAFTADFWVAEAYPFLSAFSNPHFPLSLGLLLWLLTPIHNNASTHEQGNKMRPLGSALLGLGLSLLSPFALVIAVMVNLATGFYQTLHEKRSFTGNSDLLRAIAVGVGGAPYAVYTLWVVRLDPALRQWSAQNITLSPPLWDVFLSFSPAILVGAILVAITKPANGNRALVWSVGALAMMYLPWALQRRFMVGLYVPIVTLAVLGMSNLWDARRWLRRLATAVLILAIPGNLVVLMALNHGIAVRDPQLYLMAGEAEALEWIADHTETRAVFLSSPEMGLFLPAKTGRRVLYGHPFETVNAAQEESNAVTVYRSAVCESVAETIERVDYVMWGPREKILGAGICISSMERVFSNPEVTIFRTGTKGE